MRIRPQMRKVIVIAWALSALGAFSAYFFHQDFFEHFFRWAFQYSYYLGVLLFLIAVCLRGFTFIPATLFIIAGFFFFNLHNLFTLIMIGALVSSTLVYRFAWSMHLGESFQYKHKESIHKIKRLLDKNELLIIILFSFSPFLPTDVICYVCGSLHVNYKKFIFGIFIGEGIASGLYIYFGAYISQFISTF